MNDKETDTNIVGRPTAITLSYHPVSLLPGKADRALHYLRSEFDINTLEGRNELAAVYEKSDTNQNTSTEENKNTEEKQKDLIEDKFTNSNEVQNVFSEECLICHEIIPKFTRVVPCETCNNLCHYRCWSLWHTAYSAGDSSRARICVYCKTNCDRVSPRYKKNITILAAPSSI